MIVYSFAWRKKGHSPCNIRLAEGAKRIIEAQDEPVLVFAQRTTALVLKELSVECQIVPKRSSYEGSEVLTRQPAEVFKENGITEVIPVAQPFLQLTKCIQLVHKEGFRTPSFFKLVSLIGWIGFDRESVQPWTRGLFRLVFYTARQILFSYKPPPELSE